VEGNVDRPPEFGSLGRTDNRIDTAGRRGVVAGGGAGQRQTRHVLGPRNAFAGTQQGRARRRTPEGVN
jgi:hypothetical protein